jgi:tripartite-type tricarboxylate transporter receptor subunit TctC
MAGLRRASVLLTLVLTLVLAACGSGDDAGGGDAGAEGGEASGGNLEGELITMLVGTSPGGGYDSYARLVAPFLAEELGADVTVENLSGAGGLLALNRLATAEPDGTTIMMVNGTGTVGSVLGEAEGIEFELREFGFLGRIGGEPRVMGINAGLPYETAEDLVDLGEEFRFSATGPGGNTYNDAALSIELFGLGAGDIVSGFEGSSESIVAVTAGETEAVISTADTILPHIDTDDLRPVYTMAQERLEELPDTPTLLEIFSEGEKGEMAESMVTISEVGRIFATTPGVPEDVLTELQAALETVASSEEFLAEAEAQERPIDYQTPEESVSLIEAALEAPDSVRQILIDSYAGQ